MSDEQPKNPLHGITLQQIVTTLSEHYGWEVLGTHINIRCFTHDPSVASSLKFLRRTPWARQKVEDFYLWHLRQIKRLARWDGRGEKPMEEAPPSDANAAPDAAPPSDAD